jgi:geranylgeranyl pyrophosphate synthase
LLLLPRITPKQRQLVQFVLEDRAFERTHAQEILDMVDSEGTLAEVEHMARAFADEAREALAFFPPSEARSALEIAPEFVLNRRS